MPASEARVIANRQNSLKSCGPKTPEGKERSRRNGLRHGLSGPGAVMAEGDEKEVEGRAEALRADLAPRSPLGAILVRQLATLSVKMERSARQESEAIAARARHAAEAFDEARYQQARALFEGLADDPREAVRMLRKSPEGVDRMILAWRDLRSALTGHFHPGWRDAEFERAAGLLGLLGNVRRSGVGKLHRACLGDFSGLEGEPGGELEPAARKLWALERLHEVVDAEVAALVAHRATLDHARIARDRAGAADLALFDPSREATLARRYESEARRGFFRALDEFRKAEAEVALEEEVGSAEPAPGPVEESAPLASLRGRPSALPRPSAAAVPHQSGRPITTPGRPESEVLAIGRPVPPPG